jgi:flagellar L-ring protein precursor FlgH
MKARLATNRVGVLEWAVVAVLAAGGSAVCGQSSSLYLTEPTPPAREKNLIHTPVLEQTSYAVVLPLPPRQFNPQDLVTVVIRESSTATLESSLETEKDTSVKAEVRRFPSINLLNLLKGQLNPSNRDGDAANFPGVDLTAAKEFEGEGDYERKDSLTTRLTARVIDIKPNGTLTLEARTFIQNDDEKLTITVTGYCRPEDITADNTVLSTQMYDLRVNKQHSGELRKTASKGIITKILDVIFNF